MNKTAAFEAGVKVAISKNVLRQMRAIKSPKPTLGMGIRGPEYLSSRLAAHDIGRRAKGDAFDKAFPHLLKYKDIQGITPDVPMPRNFKPRTTGKPIPKPKDKFTRLWNEGVRNRSRVWN